LGVKGIKVLKEERSKLKMFGTDFDSEVKKSCISFISRRQRGIKEESQRIFLRKLDVWSKGTKEEE
jgi:hypothetical protein